MGTKKNENHNLLMWEENQKSLNNRTFQPQLLLSFLNDD